MSVEQLFFKYTKGRRNRKLIDLKSRSSCLFIYEFSFFVLHSANMYEIVGILFDMSFVRYRRVCVSHTVRIPRPPLNRLLSAWEKLPIDSVHFEEKLLSLLVLLYAVVSMSICCCLYYLFLFFNCLFHLKENRKK